MIFMFCQKCGTENDDTAKFCKGCGSSLSSIENGDTSEATKLNKNFKILAILILIVIIAAAGVFMYMNNLQEDSQIVCMSTTVINNGSDLSVKLLDSNNNPISNKDINITIKDVNGEDLSEVGITDKNGIRSMPIFYEAGKYTFVATFAGDSDYKGSSISQSFTIKDSVKTTKDSSSSSDNPYMGTFDGTWEEGVDYKGYCTTHGWVTLNSRHHCQWCEEEGKDPRVVRDSIQSYDHYLHYYDQIQIK